MSVTVSSRRDDAARLGAAAAAVVMTLAAVLTGATLIRSHTAPATENATGDHAAGRHDHAAVTTLAEGTEPPAHDPLPASAPVRLTVPAIGIATDSVIELGRTPTGVAEVPGDPLAVGWLVDTPTPGERGSAVLAGHSHFAYERGVFYQAAQLRPGDTVTVTRADGAAAVFTVYRVERTSREAGHARAAARGSHPDLRLLAGSPDAGEHDDAIVVFARLTTVR